MISSRHDSMQINLGLRDPLNTVVKYCVKRSRSGRLFRPPNARPPTLSLTSKTTLTPGAFAPKPESKTRPVEARLRTRVLVGDIHSKAADAALVVCLAVLALLEERRAVIIRLAPFRSHSPPETAEAAVGSVDFGVFPFPGGRRGPVDDCCRRRSGLRGVAVAGEIRGQARIMMARARVVEAQAVSVKEAVRQRMDHWRRGRRACVCRGVAAVGGEVCRGGHGGGRGEGLGVAVSGFRGVFALEYPACFSMQRDQVLARLRGSSTRSS